MDNFLKQMGMRIAARRKDLGLTQEELANVVNVSIQTISTAECGKKALRPENIAKISIALNCTTDYLLLGKTTIMPSEELIRTHKNLTPLQYQCLNRIIENYLVALSSEPS
jgi:transcriptional regulator with XRE-family HTH domain